MSYWNLYQISYSVDTADDFSSTLAAIGPGEALIINIEGGFEYEGQEYSRGDIILRLTDGTYATIKASVAGFYYPSKVKKVGKNYTLYYNYHQDSAYIDQATAIPIVYDDVATAALEKPYSIEYFELEVASAADSFMYGEKVDMSATNTYSFIAVPNGTNVIPPIIKFFTANGEEVALDFTCVCTTQGTQKVYNLAISNNSKPSALKYVYIK